MSSDLQRVEQAWETIDRAVENLRASQLPAYTGQLVAGSPLVGPLADWLESLATDEHGPTVQDAPDNSCYSCGGTGEVYLGTGPDGHAWSGDPCCCSHEHCKCGACGGYPCEQVQYALAVARAILGEAAELIRPDTQEQP